MGRMMRMWVKVADRLSGVLAARYASFWSLGLIGPRGPDSANLDHMPQTSSQPPSAFVGHYLAGPFIRSPHTCVVFYLGILWYPV